MSHNVRVLGLFKDFDSASNAIRDVREANLPAFNPDDITLISPIEHPEPDEVLGKRPIHVQLFTLGGAITGGTLGFTLIAAAQGNFFSQMKGGKPIIPLPPDFVLTYEMLILGGVYITVLGFLICAGLPLLKKDNLYDTKISEDHFGVVIKANKSLISAIKDIFGKHKALEVKEEVAQ